MDSQELVAIKKVLQDKRFKVSPSPCPPIICLLSNLPTYKPTAACLLLIYPPVPAKLSSFYSPTYPFTCTFLKPIYPFYLPTCPTIIHLLAHLPVKLHLSVYPDPPTYPSN